MTMNNSPEISCPVIILAGGLGTRLRAVTHDRPKILAPLPNDPEQHFLIFYLRWLQAQGAKRIVFSLGYKAELVIAELARLRAMPEFSTLQIQHLVESEPLGTLGAMRYTFSEIAMDSALVLNGDTLVDCCLADFVNDAKQTVADGFSFAAIRHQDTRRFGRVIFDEQQNLSQFQEKQLSAPVPIQGWINAGIYYFSGAFIKWVIQSSGTSFEDICLQSADFTFARRVFPIEQPAHGSADTAFIDIGTPESWKMLTRWLNS